MLSQLAHDWLITKEFQEVANDVMRMLRNFMGNKTFLITHVSKKRVSIVQSAKGSVPIHQGLSYSSHEAIYDQWEGTSHEELVIYNTEVHPLTKDNAFCKRFGIRSYLGVPLILKNGEFFGTLSAIDDEPYEFTAIDIDTMKTLANLMSKTIELHKVSAIDHLTGLYNKAYLENKLATLSVNTSEQYGVILFDIDNFKNINDTYGHTVGDNVLGYIGKCVQDSMPEESIPFRFGGDEFCVFVPELNAEKLVPYVEHLQKCVLKFKATPISLSIGISDTTRSDHESLLDTADIALYKAKKKGKDQYSIYID